MEEDSSVSKEKTSENEKCLIEIEENSIKSQEYSITIEGTSARIEENIGMTKTVPVGANIDCSIKENTITVKELSSNDNKKETSGRQKILNFTLTTIVLLLYAIFLGLLASLRSKNKTVYAVACLVTLCVFSEFWYKRLDFLKKQRRIWSYMIYGFIFAIAIPLAYYVGEQAKDYYSDVENRSPVASDLIGTIFILYGTVIGTPQGHDLMIRRMKCFSLIVVVGLMIWWNVQKKYAVIYKKPDGLMHRYYQLE